jgi:hypothetical protein
VYFSSPIALTFALTAVVYIQTNVSWVLGFAVPTTKLARTDRFWFLNKAATIAEPSELDSHGISNNGWRLCSLQQVEQLKCLVAIAPVWVSGIGCFITMDQQSTFGVLN